MIKRKEIPLLALTFGCIVLFSAANTAAQIIERERFKSVSTSKDEVKNKTSRKNEKINRKNALLKLIAPKRTKVVTDITSDLTIITEPNAKVTMTPQGGRRTAKPIEKIAAGGEAEFENLKPGRYAISATLNDFVEEQSVVDIPARQSYKLDFPLEPIEYQLSIEANISEGEIRYAPAALVGVNPNGSLKLEPEGNYCIVQIKNNKAKIEGLRKKHYTIDVTPSPTALQYEPLRAAIEPDDIVDKEDETEGLKIVEIKLETKLSETAFAPTLQTSNEWQLPSGWKLENKLSTTAINGVALPSNGLYRHYIDFEMVSNARSLDGKTVGFALRAVDSKNYYLVQIGGEKVAERYLLSSYVVRDGEIKQQLYSVSISHFKEVIDNKKSFRVTIKGRGNTFEVFMDDKNGKPQPLGKIIDPLENFKKGAVGIAETNNSNFEINFFTVCPSSCIR